MVSFACPIFFKIGRALWALISNIGLNKLSPNPIGQVPARLGPNSKETTIYSSYSHTAYMQLSINSSSPHVQKGGLAKHQKPTYTNKEK